MADHLRIHPVEAEIPPSAPLAPRSQLASEKGDPSQYNHAIRHPPPYWRSQSQVPLPPPRRVKRKNCCCRCLCWTFGLLLLLVVTVAITVGVLYLLFQPKMPSYSIGKLRIRTFQISQVIPLTVYSQFVVTVTANNPNEKIGIYYENGSKLSVWYTDIKLCSGKLPVFYQGHQNTTVLALTLTGQNEVGSNLRDALMEQQQTGIIPLDFQGEIPVRVEFGTLKLMRVTFMVRCSLVVDSLTANGQVNIKADSCNFRLKL